MIFFRVFGDSNFDLIEKALTKSFKSFPNMKLDKIYSFGQSDNDNKAVKLSENDNLLTFFIPSFDFRLLNTYRSITEINDFAEIAARAEEYCFEIEKKLDHSDLNIIVLPRQPGEFNLGRGLGLGDYSSDFGYKKGWFKFCSHLINKFESKNSVIIYDSESLFGLRDYASCEDVNRLKLEMLAEQTWQEAQFFANKLIELTKAYFNQHKIKCICLDLDNTLWGGVFGDVGLGGLELGGLTANGRAFLEVQNFFKSLKNRGFFLALVSKNYLSVALEGIEAHPDMILKKDDFQILYCGWGPKSERIKSISKSLNISESAVVFFDDSLFEREEVKRNAPEVLVPDYSSNPIVALQYLKQLTVFDVVGVNEDDFNRNSSVTMSHSAIKGEEFQSFNSDISTTESEKSSLDLLINYFEIDDSNFSRTLQLLNKTNQFNLSSSRFSDKSLRRHLLNADISIIASVKDKYASYGLTAILIATVNNSKLIVSDFVMSCRVFGRGVEHEIFQHCCKLARNSDNNLRSVQFDFLQTDRNQPISEFLFNIGKTGGSRPFSVSIEDYIFDVYVCEISK